MVLARSWLLNGPTPLCVRRPLTASSAAPPARAGGCVRRELAGAAARECSMPVFKLQKRQQKRA